LRLLVIGGSGFIGTRLTSVLVREGHQVTVFDRRAPSDERVSYLAGDIRDSRSLSAATANIDTVYHLAAEHRDDLSRPKLYYDVNTTGMRTLVAACRANGVRRIIFTSTVACYGLDKNCPDETAPVSPFNDYGRSKAQAEEILLDWASAEGNQAVIVRLSVVFGESNRGNVYNLLRQIERRRFPMVGDGRNLKSMAYVGNVADFLAWINSNVRSTQVFNYADKPDMSTKELVANARALMGIRGEPIYIPYRAALLLGQACDLAAGLLRKPLPFSKIRVTKFCAETTIDSSKAFRSGFTPRHSLEGALQKTVQNEFLPEEAQRQAR
jgi:nucleoside-diphosphate-sugar epimerase